MTDFEANNQTIRDIGSQQEWSQEELAQFATAVAENMADLLTREPLTDEQVEATNNFLV